MVKFPTGELSFLPVDTGSPLIGTAVVDSCQFCGVLTGDANCGASLIGGPQQLFPTTSPLLIQARNMAVNPLTLADVGLPLPAGHYAVTVIEQTGQAWSVPNDLFRSDSLQGKSFVVTP